MKKILLSLLMLFTISCSNVITLKKTYNSLQKTEKQQVDSYLENANEIFDKKNNEVVLIFQYNCFSGKKIKINNKKEINFQKEGDKLYFQQISKINKDEGGVNITMGKEKVHIRFIKDYDYILVCYYEQEKKWNLIYHNYPKIIVPN